MVSLLALGVGAALAAPQDSERFTVGLPLELDLVGLAVGAHPELLWRPLKPDGALHLRTGTGLMVGPELTLLPLSLGVREVFLPRRAVRPGLGTGVQLQTFFPRQHEPVVRLDLTIEATLDVRVAEGWRVGLQVSPEFGMVGGFGLGMATRLGVSADLPRLLTHP
jgi:hypothetical protein